jgi:hypothetical protein
MRRVLLARLTCSDPRCGAEIEAEGVTLAELATLACECGGALELIAWPDEVGELGLVGGH